MALERRFPLLIFDWDGTLFDSTATIVDALQRAFADLGLAVPERVACRHVIGLGLVDALRYLNPSLPESDYPRLVAAYREHYLGGNHRLALFDGVAAALQRYRAMGYFLAVATGKSRHGLDVALDSSGLRPLFDMTRCADESFSKPHPQMIFDILEFTDIAASSALMIGDTSHDMELARNAGTAAVAVSYGAHGRAELLAYAPLACVDSFAELDAWLYSNT